ncbi:bifunctional diaminohydroxyphosphoribosylaminopyrimidine deaminase/5-amino-6-(5-phosphoribosylamino)uracil reductase RibD [Microbacterium sp. MYb45]|uniref:bifunctional diaminohydroxyphosphoribosylaminopyrimidine deaminase/5-amino-6-(5-phosphoribosylamino)uracil reductase RibD n=3 Tax=unclassified Microbacterium TaxID=2609290 RepID=UPI000CFF15C3|nr:bifunctional diaminohydroxyphosphoribosylaminopyrimidine deaminase/5-amino-6-(5-phosphoribosylamino)uracil reductase RibD [Microbacterium sp. MYb45]PRB64623.1 riboflavin biosynthesis protein RibD [Microbacterium sp. MYb45]
MAVNAAERSAMDRALQLATRGPRGANPQVGAVILSPDGTVLAEGWHHGAGTPHAEVDALSKLAPGDARGATAVVTLEPCNHTGRTGPCAVALIEAGVARVVYALDDPGAESGGGADRLRAAGVDVESGEQADAAHALIEGWLMAQRLGRPHITVKWAQSLDGRAAAADGSSQWITGPAARADVHRRRADADAIVVGTGTVLADDPALTARDGDDLLPHQPVPVVIGSRPTPTDAAVHRHPHSPLFYDTRDLRTVTADLHARGIQSVFVEGGPTLASAFIEAGLADRVLAYIAPVLLGGDKLALGDIGVASIDHARRLTIDEWVPLGRDLLAIAHPAVATDPQNQNGAA